MAPTVLFKKTVPLPVIAAQVGDEFLAAVYAGIARKTKYGLESGSDLDGVVQHYLEHDGFSDDAKLLSKIRMQIQLACDLSGSMFRLENGKPIVPAMTMMRMFQRALRQAKETLSAETLRYSLWLWSVSEYGGHDICLDDLLMGTYIPPQYHDRPLLMGLPAPLTPLEVDKFFEDVMMVKPEFKGTGTQLLPLVQSFRKWEDNYGDTGAYCLDIVVTDGRLYPDDIKAVNKVQSERLAYGKRMGALIQIGQEKVIVPEGFTLYNCKPQYLDLTIREILLTFVQKIF